MDRLIEILERVETKVDERLAEINNDIKDLAIASAKQNAQLAEHMRRTSLAEENIEMLRQEAQTNKFDLDSQIQPLRDHVALMNLLIKFLAGAVATGATLAGLIKAIGLLS